METPSKVPWDKIREDWRAREFDALHLSVSARVGNVEAVDALLFPDDAPVDDDVVGPDFPAEARAVLGEAFAGVEQGDHALLALYVYGLCLRKWEQSEAYERIRIALDALHHEAPEGAARVVSEQALHVKDAMGVEQAMNCSCALSMRDSACQVLVRLSNAVLDEQALVDGGRTDGLWELVRSDARTSTQYFVAIQAIADAVRGYLEGNRAALEDGLRTLAAHDGSALRGDVYESELRSHRAMLEALRDQSTTKPEVLVEAAEVAYVYPFALGGPGSFDEVVTVALKPKKKWRALTSAGIAPVHSGELDFNDLWVGEPRYSGASIELPPLTVTTSAGAIDPERNPPVELEAEVRLSRLGNHHLVLRSSLEDAGLHELNQALRRGCHGMGAESMSWDGMLEPAAPDKLTRYAKVVIEAIAWDLGFPSPSAADGSFHVVLGVRSLSLRSSSGVAPDPSLEKLKSALGASLLFHPVRHLTTSLHEWVRYPKPKIQNLIEGQAYEGDLVVRTENTTVAYLPGSPEWLIDEYQELIEFIASIPPLLRLWERRTRELAEEVSDEWLQEAVKETRAERFPIDRLEDHETKIRILESGIRRGLAILDSPRLVRTRAQREFLDRLWTAAGLKAAETALERQLALLSDRQQRIATLLSSIDQRVRRVQREQAQDAAEEQRRLVAESEKKRRHAADRTERQLTVVGLLLALAGFAELASWVNQLGNLKGLTWGLIEAAILLGIALFVFTWIWKIRKDSSEQEEPKEQQEPRGQEE